MLQLKSTCDACLNKNCSQSTTIKETLVNTMKKCRSPVYNVIYTIANHSRQLLKTIRNLRNVAIESGNYGFITAERTNDDYDSCLCNH